MSKVKCCPKCGKDYVGVSALSRDDNCTLICPRCGTNESLDAAREMIGGSMDDTEFNKYKQIILNEIERSGHSE